MKLKKHQNEAISAIDKYLPVYNCILEMVMRSGKTLTVLKYMSDNIDKYKRYLWIAENEKEKKIEFKKEFDKLLKNKLIHDIYNNIDITLPQSLHKVDLSKYGLVIFNECQGITKKRFELLKNAKKIIGITGTVPHKKEKQDLLKKLNFKIVYKYPLKRAIEDGIVADYRITVYEVPMTNNKVIPIKKNDDKDDSVFYVSEINSHDYLWNKLVEVQSEIDPLKAKKDQIQVKIDEFDSYDMESYRNREILRELYSKNRDIMGELYPLYNEKKELSLHLSIRLNSFPSKLQAAKQYLSDKQNKRYLVFARTHEDCLQITPYVYNSHTDDTWLKAFENNKTSNLGLLNKASTGHTFGLLDGCCLTVINSSNVFGSQRMGRTILFRDNYIADIAVFISKGTIQKEWFLKAFVDFDQNKITFKNWKYDKI